jgi:hypothetical protein
MFLIMLFLSWGVLTLFTWFIYDRVVIDFVEIKPAGLEWAIIPGIGLVMSIVATLLSLTNKTAWLKIDAEGELHDHGYTPKYLEMMKKVVEELKPTPGKRDFPSSVVRLANAYLVFDQPDAAYQTINLLNPNALKSKFTSSPADQSMLMNYYDVQMAVCEELCDLRRADAVMQDARPFIDRVYKSSSLTDLAIDEMCCTYYCMYGDFGIAQSFADHCMSKQGNYILFGHLLNAKICNYQGDYKGADSYLHAAEQVAGKKVLYKACVHEYKKQMEQKRCQLQNNFQA